MTQQSEADDRGDDAAGHGATRGTGKYRQDLPSGGKTDPGCDIDRGPQSTRCPSLQPEGATPMEVRTDLARLESAFPTFSFTICEGWGGPRFEAWRDVTRSGLYAIITDDPRELWRELDMAVR